MGRFGRADAGGERLGQVLRLDVAALTEDEGVLDDVLQFADVAGEIMAHERGQGLVRYADDVLALLGAVFADKMLDEQGDVLLALAQGRQADLDHVEPVEQVVAEGARPHQRLQVAVGGGDDAHVRLDRGV